MIVTQKYVVKGAIYSLEQCGLLLKDAALLVNQKSYSSAVVLAAFAREELGRSIILIDFFEKIVKQNKSITLKELEKACEDHVIKQKRGQLSTVLKFKSDSNFGKLIISRNKLLMSNLQQTEEFKKIEKQIADVTAKLRRRTPSDRHRTRTEALYVMPDSLGTGWNIPKKVSSEFARDFVMDAVNDYSLQRQILQRGLSSHTEFTDELLRWKERPEPPQPIWPEWFP